MLRKLMTIAFMAMTTFSVVANDNPYGSFEIKNELNKDTVTVEYNIIENGVISERSSMNVPPHNGEALGVPALTDDMTQIVPREYQVVSVSILGTSSPIKCSGINLGQTYKSVKLRIANDGSCNAMTE